MVPSGKAWCSSSCSGRRGVPGSEKGTPSPRRTGKLEQLEPVDRREREEGVQGRASPEQERVAAQARGSQSLEQTLRAAVGDDDVGRDLHGYGPRGEDEDLLARLGPRAGGKPDVERDAAKHDRIDLVVELRPAVRLVRNEVGHDDEHGDPVGRSDEPVDAHAHARADGHACSFLLFALLLLSD
jgi:hypothetical protein